MSVLIKMEMPSGCFACPMVSGYMLLREGKIEPCVKAGLCRLNRKIEVQIDGRPQDCPLVPVPPHGRLGDLDELEKSFRKEADVEWNRFAAPVNWTDAFDDVANIVADAPTVLEAEEGE